MKKQLVSLKREKLDGFKIQGFLIDESEELALFNYVYDFNLDGLMVLRKKDISLLETSKTDKFQTKLLKLEGIYKNVLFDAKYNLSSWKDFFESAKKKHKYFIVEQEEFDEPEYTIGTISKINKKSINMKYFTGIGRWLDSPQKIEYENITSVQIGSNYLNVYERHFQQKNA